MDAFLRKFFFCRGNLLEEKCNIFLQKKYILIFSEFWVTFWTFFFKTAIYGCRGTILKNLTFPKIFSTKFFRDFEEKFRHLAKRFGTWGSNVSVNIDKTAFHKSIGKNVDFESWFPNITELRLNVNKIGKQLVGRVIFCVDDFLSFIQVGGN